MKTALSHVDVRVSDRARAIGFYDAILVPLGFERAESEAWITYELRDDDSETTTWFGFTLDPSVVPSSTRVAIAAETCEIVDHATTAAIEAGARNIEGPEYAYGPDYYAVFFEDPDGNKLEVCCYGPRAQAAG